MTVGKSTKIATTADEAVRLDRPDPINDGPTHTGDGRIVGPFLEAVAHDERFGTYHAACAEEFNEMTVAVRDYFNKLVEVEGADMPGLHDLDEAMEYTADGRIAHFPDVGQSMTLAEAVEGEGKVIPLSQYIEQPEGGSFTNHDKS
jgi:hypothetical protein